MVDDIIRSFLNLHPDTPMDKDEYVFSLREIKQVVEAAVKAEREACAKVCASFDLAPSKPTSYTIRKQVEAIRARGQE